MVEQVAQPADIAEHRPNLPPLDEATDLLGKSRGYVAFARGVAKGMEPGATSVAQRALTEIKNALNTATEKQQSAMEKIREFQRIPGNN